MKFKKALITSFQNEVHLYHIAAKGTNEEIGYVLGRLAKDSHNINKSTDIGSYRVASQYSYLKQHYPAHYARMSCFAKAYGKSLREGGYDFSFFGQVPDGTACSAIYYPPATTSNRHGYISRNLDFSIPRDISQPAFPFKHAYIVEMYPESCYPSISLFCFEVFGLALEGINSEGLSVIHLADHDTRIDHENLSTDQTRKGFNEFLPIQYLLDTCSTAHEAAEALKQLDHYHAAIPVHLLIADKQGDSFVFEYASDGTKKVFVKGSSTTPLKITNFQLNRLSDAAMKKKIESRHTENGFDRYRILEKRLDQIQFPVTEKLIQETNAAVYVHADSEDKLDRTLFHCIYDISSCSVKVCHLPTTQQSKRQFYEYSLKRC
jgi:predicted choloylglycine hydrolase